MTPDEVEATADEILAWARDHDHNFDRDIMGELLDVSRTMLGRERLADLRAGDLERLLLEVYPEEELYSSVEDAFEVAAAARVLVSYLADTKVLPDEVIAAFVVEVMGAEKVFADEAAAGGLVEILATLGIHQDSVAPVRLPAQAELIEAAKRSELLHQTHRFGTWAGDGQPLTEDDSLTREGVVAAAAAVGVEVADVEDITDAPAIALLDYLADGIGFTASTDDQVSSGPFLEWWPDQEPLRLWGVAFPLTLTSLRWDAAVYDEDIDFGSVGLNLSAMLLLARGDGVPVAEIQEMVSDVVEDPEALATWVSEYGDPAQTVASRLESLGAVTISDGVLRLTPLGLSALRDQLAEDGLEIPLLPAAEELTARDVVAVAMGTSATETASELAAWLSHRDKVDAARELLDVAVSGSAAQRIWAATAVAEFGPETEPAWRDAMDKQPLRPYAKYTLAHFAGHQPPDLPAEFELDPAETAWMTLDGLTIAIDIDPGSVAVALPEGHEQDVLNAMWRLPHDDVVEVLTAVGQHHPDKKIAKFARTVAHKATTFHSHG